LKSNVMTSERRTVSNDNRNTPRDGWRLANSWSLCVDIYIPRSVLAGPSASTAAPTFKTELMNERHLSRHNTI